MVPPSSPTQATGPSTQEMGLPSADTPSGPVVATSRLTDQAALAILASQVQQLTMNQSSSQQLQGTYVSQQAVQQQMQSLLAHLQPQRLPQPQPSMTPSQPQMITALPP